MHKIVIAFYFVLFTSALSAEETPIKPKKESDYRMAFSPWMLFADKTFYTNFNGSKYSGIAPGLQVSYLQPWGMGEGEPGTFDGGGYIRFHVGYGKIKTGSNGSSDSKNWIPYDFSLGAYGSYVLNNANHEIGYEYGMLGIYGYSVFAYYGSQITLKYRYRFLQLDATRGGTGGFRGAFVPKFESAATHSVGLTCLLPKNLLAGLRYSSIPSGGANTHFATEWRVFFGYNFSNNLY